MSKFNIQIDLDDLKSELLDVIDASDLVDLIDLSDLADSVSGYLDMDTLVSDAMDNQDFSLGDYLTQDSLYDLMTQYNPDNGCALGIKVTDMVSEAIRHLLTKESALVNVELKTFIGKMIADTLVDQGLPHPVTQVVENNLPTIGMNETELMAILHNYSILIKDGYIEDEDFFGVAGQRFLIASMRMYSSKLADRAIEAFGISFDDVKYVAPSMPPSLSI
jgi:hypothetical protein